MELITDKEKQAYKRSLIAKLKNRLDVIDSLLSYPWTNQREYCLASHDNLFITHQSILSETQIPLFFKDDKSDTGVKARIQFYNECFNGSELFKAVDRTTALEQVKQSIEEFLCSLEI